MALADPENISNTSWDSFIVYFVVVLIDGDILIMLELYTNQYPTRFNISCEIQHFNTTLHYQHLGGNSEFAL